MQFIRYFALPALAVGLMLTGCGSAPEPAPVVTTKAPTVAEVAGKMEIATPTPEAIDLVELGMRCLDNHGDVDACSKMLDTCRRAVGVHQRGCVTGFKRCMSTVADQQRCFKPADNEPAKEKPVRTAKPIRTPKPKPQTIKECLADEGFTTEVDADSPTMITVNGDDGLAVAFLNQMATAKDARESQAMIDDMEADAREQADEDGWSADTAENMPTENVGRYVINYLYPEDGEEDAIHNCVENFTRSN